MKKDDDNLFLKKEIQNPDLIKQTSDLIEQWEARLPYSPIGTFSQDTTFVKLVDHACLRIEVMSQVVYRNLQHNQFPDDGENCPEIPDDLNSFDIWKQECQMNLDFEEHKNSLTINETRERLICDKCKAKGVLNCSSCDGTGKVNCDRYDPETLARGIRLGERAVGCGGSGQKDVVSTSGEWLGKENCSKCHGSGQIKCKKCSQGLAKCDICNGLTKIIRCSSIEQVESPIKEEMTYISSELPDFKSKDHSPLHNLKGDLCFTQNDMQIITSLECTHEEINKIVWNILNDYLKNNDCIQAALKSYQTALISSGRILRQLVNVYNCPISEYFFNFKGTEYSIFVNRETNAVEDVSGPIAQERSRLEEESTNLAKEKKYLQAFVANQKSKTLQANNEWEIKARKALVDTTELTSKISSIGIEQTKQLSSIGMEKSKQLFSKFFGKSKNPEEKNEG